MISESIWPVHSTYAPPASPKSARLARQLTRGALQGCPELLVDIAELLVGELVGNAVRHASAAPVMRIEVESGGVRMIVQDDSSTLPMLPDFQQPAPEADGGRGLRLVASLQGVCLLTAH